MRAPRIHKMHTKTSRVALVEHQLRRVRNCLRFISNNAGALSLHGRVVDRCTMTGSTVLCIHKSLPCSVNVVSLDTCVCATHFPAPIGIQR